jgi:hypothetical protein
LRWGTGPEKEVGRRGRTGPREWLGQGGLKGRREVWGRVFFFKKLFLLNLFQTFSTFKILFNL